MAIPKKRLSPQGLLSRIDHFLTHPLGLDTRARHFYPTSASCIDSKGKIHGACLRKNAYEFYGIEPTNPLKADAFYTFGVGKHIELMLVDWLQKMGLFIDHNVKFFNPDFFLSGELDVVIRETPGSDQMVCVEIKSSHGPYFTMENVTGKEGQPPKPKEDHVQQVSLYLDNFDNLPYAILVYIGRDNFSRTEYIIRLVEQDGNKYPEITRADGSSYVDYNLGLADIYNRYRDLLDYIKHKQLPPRDYVPLMDQKMVDKLYEAGEITANKKKKWEKGECLTTEFHCTYCNFRNLCRGMDKGIVTDFVDRYNKGEFKPMAYPNSMGER
jgi:hypothetical protein